MDKARGKTMRILAVDPGTSCGWALRKLNGEIVAGAWDLKPGRHEGSGMRFLKLETSLGIMRSQFGIDVVVLEDVRGHTATYAAQIYGGLVATIEQFCERHRIPYQGISVHEVKKHATGKGNASKTEMVLACEKKLGVLPLCDNEADARWLLDLAVERLEGKGCRGEEKKNAE